MPSIGRQISKLKNPRLTILLGCAAIWEQKEKIEDFQSLVTTLNFIEHCIKNSRRISVDEYIHRIRALGEFYWQGSYGGSNTDIEYFLRQSLNYFTSYNMDHFLMIRHHLVRIKRRLLFFRIQHIVPQWLFDSFFKMPDETIPNFPAHIKGLAEEIYDGFGYKEILCDALSEFGWPQEWLRKTKIYPGNWVIDTILGNRHEIHSAAI